MPKPPRYAYTIRMSILTAGDPMAYEPTAAEIRIMQETIAQIADALGGPEPDGMHVPTYLVDAIKTLIDQNAKLKKGAN